MMMSVVTILRCVHVACEAAALQLITRVVVVVVAHVSRDNGRSE